MSFVLIINTYLELNTIIYNKWVYNTYNFLK